MAKQYYHIEDELFNEFREKYPELWEYGTIYDACGFEAIRIRIPNKGCVKYDRFHKSLTWLDHNGDKNYEKELRIKRREKMYDSFIDTVKKYQEEHNISQGTIAELSGISRRKINEYINGKYVPKMSTMCKILKSLNIDEIENNTRKHVDSERRKYVE